MFLNLCELYYSWNATKFRKKVQKQDQFQIYVYISFGLNLSEIRPGRLYYLIVPKVQAILSERISSNPLSKNEFAC